MIGKMLLFSDHIWFYCYEHQVDEFIRNHRWKLPDGWKLPDDYPKYVIVYDEQKNYTKIEVEV